MLVSRIGGPARFVLVVAAGLALLLALPLFAPSGAAATTLRDGPAPQPHPDDLDPEETAPVPGASTRSGGPLASAAVSGAEKAALQRLLAANPSDLWAVSDAVAASIMPTWDSKTGSYRSGNVIRARANAEMLLVHSQAILAGHHGTANQPKRIAALVKLLTGPAWVEQARAGVNQSCPHGGAECWHAAGFVDVGARDTMHRSRDAVVMRALAAAYQARKGAGLSAALTSRLRYVVSTTARSPFWQMPKRLANQVNWTADVMDAYTTVTGSDTLIRREYPAQLHWFLSRARRLAYPGGTDNLSTGLGFHYAPTRPDSYLVNGEDTVEYANITFGAMKYLDRARAEGAPALSASDRTMLRRWTAHLMDGGWTAGGYPNWDSGHGIDRLHLNQYWLLSLRGMAMGLAGSAKQQLFPHQVTVARSLVRHAVQLYQRRAKDAGTPSLGPSAYGFYGSTLLGDHFDGLTGTARMAEIMAEFARAGLGSGTTTRLPSAYSHDSGFGRLAVTAAHYSAAVIGPWRGLHSGGAEPSRILDAKSRVLTQIGGGGNGTLGLMVSLKGAPLVDTQPGLSGRGVSRIHVDGAHRNRSGPLGRGLLGTADASGRGIAIHLAHRLTERGITTTYTIHNRRGGALDGELRVPTYGNPNGSSFHKHKPSVASLRGLDVTTADGGAFRLSFRGLPKGASTRVVFLRGEQSNPTPGAELLIRFKLPRGTTRIERGIAPR